MSGAELLSAFLHGAGISGAVFARAAGLDPSILSRYLAGERRPTLDVATMIERRTFGKVPASAWAKSE